MEQLIKQIMERTGISEEQAKQAVETVLTFLKGQLPPALGSQLDSVISGDLSSLGSIAGQAQGALGGLFGKK
jgi:uncharacterized protein (DUF2267 family)